MSDLTACLHAVTTTITQVEHENRLVNKYTARDFTPFRFMNWGEVPSTHLLAFFLNSSQDHGQGILFQEIFMARLRKELPDEGRRLPAARWEVEAERRYAGYGQLDLLLTTTDRRFGICVENKPRDQTIDQPNQLNSYRALLRRHHQENYLLIYLSSRARVPDTGSIKKQKREELTNTGHYVNLTYRDFILPLLDDWYQVVHPESLRIFLRQFRHHVEQWLQFESTKPAQLMQNQEIATTLAASADNVRTAFQIQASISTLRHNLLSQLTQELTGEVAGLTGAPHWSYNSFFKAENYKPFLIRRPSPTGNPEDLPWGRYAITLEFMDNRLLYGVRFDRIDWYKGSTESAVWPAGVAVELSPVPLPEGARRNEWWPWSNLAGPLNDLELYPAIVDKTSDLWQKLRPEIVRLSEALDKWSATSVPENQVASSEQDT